MDAERINQIITAHLEQANRSAVGSVRLYDATFLAEIVSVMSNQIAADCAKESKPEPPEPPKTVLPDMSDAELGKTYWFLGEDGTKVEYRRDNAFDDLLWIVRGGSGPCSNWSPARYFISHYPHLGRLRRAVPGEVAE